MRRTPFLALFFALSILGTPAEAGENGAAVSMEGSVRVREKSFSSLDPRGGSTSWWEHRTRLEPSIAFSDTFTFHSQFDILEYTGMFAGSGVSIASAELFPYQREYTPAPGTFSNDHTMAVRATRAWFEWTSPLGLLEVGRAPSHWGMGILSNNGNGYRNSLGDAYYGDSFDRILFGTKPLGKESNLTTAIGFDKLYTGNLDSTIDDADEFLVVVMYNTPDLAGGAYVINRAQDTTKTSIWISDGYIKAAPGIFRLEAEAAYIAGHTEALPTPLAGGSRIVQQVGATLKAGAVISPVSIFVDAGYASGDGDPLGGKITQFYFHPDYNAGLILFEEALALDTARAVQSFEKIQGSLTPGTRNFATRGAVTNALYVMPSIRVAPVENLSVLLAFLYAKADQPWVNPYATVVNQTSGLRNLRGGALSTDLGWEVDGRVSYTLFSGSVIAGVEGGYFKPGKAFDSAVDRAKPISTVQFSLTSLF